MTLSDALFYLKGIIKTNRILSTEREAIRKAIDVIEAAIDVEAWDEEEKHDLPMCIHCSTTSLKEKNMLV